MPGFQGQADLLGANAFTIPEMLGPLIMLNYV